MNILQYAAACDDSFRNFVLQTNGREVKSTFYSDFTIAEFWNKKAIKETYDNSQWALENLEMGIDLALVLGTKASALAESKPEFAELYADLFYKFQDLLYSRYEGDAEAEARIFNALD